MPDYTPKPEHKFTFGLWTVGNIGRDPFGGPVRETLSPVELVHLLEGTGAMPGNLAYIVAEDLSDPDVIWITEVWRSKADHANSLSLPAVRETIARARPLIAGAGTRAETRPVGFQG